MRAFAPGKLVLTGAYAVLEGAPAIAVAVQRGATADAARVAKAPTPEVRAALGADVSAPEVDASSMFVDGRKLGLGASAAILVASLAARILRAGGDLSDGSVRDELFAKARAAHAEVQSGGSGIDVAASVYGGALEYRMGERPASVSLPTGLSFSVYACRTSARTTELRAEVDRLAARDPGLHRECMTELTEIADLAASAVRADDAAAFVSSLRRSARALARLGDAAGVGIVPTGFDELERIAASEGASFTVSGAGGGDVAVFFGSGPVSARFDACATQFGLFPLVVPLDRKGVRMAPLTSAHPGVSLLSERT
jgi:phosphomevalonate kinase